MCSWKFIFALWLLLWFYMPLQFSHSIRFIVYMRLFLERIANSRQEISHVRKMQSALTNVSIFRVIFLFWLPLIFHPLKIYTHIYTMTHYWMLPSISLNSLTRKSTELLNGTNGRWYNREFRSTKANKNYCNVYLTVVVLITDLCDNNNVTFLFSFSLSLFICVCFCLYFQYIFFFFLLRLSFLWMMAQQ